MSTVTIEKVVTFTRIDCGACGGSYCLNENYRQHKQDTSGKWTCPYCNVACGYTGNEASRLRRQLERANRDARWHQERQADERAGREKAERRLSATKGANTRIRNRIKHGVCLCCNRTFANLAAHMKTKHPEFTPQDSKL